MFELITIEVTPFQQNARLIVSPETKSCIILDPGGESHLILSEIEKGGLDVEAIWLTHSHLDHCGGVKAVKEQIDVPLYGNEIEASMRQHVTDICAIYGIPPGDMDSKINSLFASS